MKQRGEGTTFDFRALLEKQNRTRLAVVLGGAAMLLLLLSELLPATPPAEPSAASASQALVYREQLEAQLQDLIGQIDGAGATAVMVTLETGRRPSMLRTRSRDRPKARKRMCCWMTARLWRRRSIIRRCAGSRSSVTAGEMSGSLHGSPSLCGHCWIFRLPGSV